MCDGERYSLRFQVIVLAAGTNTFLTGRRTCVGTLVKAKVNILELVHTCVGKQQCGVVTGTTGLEATIVCPLDSMNFRNVDRISDAVNIYIFSK